MAEVAADGISVALPDRCEPRMAKGVDERTEKRVGRGRRGGRRVVTGVRG